jgi:hypothetical protein
MTNGPIPIEAWEKIRAFLQARRTGNVSLDVKEGRVLAWKITEHGRVAKESERPYSARQLLP